MKNWLKYGLIGLVLGLFVALLFLILGILRVPIYLAGGFLGGEPIGVFEIFILSILIFIFVGGILFLLGSLIGLIKDNKK